MCIEEADSGISLDDALIAIAWALCLGNSIITHMCKIFGPILLGQFLTSLMGHSHQGTVHWLSSRRYSVLLYRLDLRIQGNHLQCCPSTPSNTAFIASICPKCGIQPLHLHGQSILPMELVQAAIAQPVDQALNSRASSPECSLHGLHDNHFSHSVLASSKGMESCSPRRLL